MSAGPREGARAAFAEAFGGAPAGVWGAPGRVNLIGEHVDYNGGLCLPLALPAITAAAVRPREGGVLRLVSTHDGERWEGSLDDVGPGTPQGWAAYLAGVAWALRAGGVDVPGLDVAVDSDVPVGAGLSSSAALECSLALAIADLSGLADDEPTRRRLAAACVRAENEVAGAPTGGMDQAVSLLARAGHALLLDCRDGTHEHVPLTLADAGLTLLVIDTRAPHRLVDGQYAARRDACADAARRLGVVSLRDVGNVEAVAGQLTGDEQVRRVRHVVTEIARVTDTVDALADNRFDRVGELLDASHASLRDDYEVSSVELDLAVDAARGSGALGARMTGGGFGGSAVALVAQADVDRVSAAVRSAFAADLAQPAFLCVEPAAGARRLD